MSASRRVRVRDCWYGSGHRLFPVAVGPAEGAAIRSWVIREQAGRTIEVGLGYGISALFACEGLFTVVGRAHGMSSSTRISTPGSLARGCNTWTRPTSHGRRFDLAIVDGNHRFDAVFVDLYYLGRLLRPGGIIFLDDYQLPGVARAASFFTANLGWAVEESCTAEDRHHWAVLRTSTSPDTRPFDYFSEF